LDRSGDWHERISALVTKLRRGPLTGEEAWTADHLKALVENYPYYQRLIDLETAELSSLQRTREKVRELILKTRTVPEWIADAENAFEAHRLGTLLRQSLATDPDDLTGIAKQLREGQDQRLRLIGAVIERKRKVAVAMAVRRPANRIALRELSKILNRRSRTDSLLALRGQIDYGAVLEVFPAWVCTIEDVARLFPLQPGLFDVLIVDEASQCAQTTALPLAFRAKRMIVAGDEEQLKPAAARFLAPATISALQSGNGLDQHPKAMFINGRDSFLELAEACSNARDFLDEHFRCDPAIIRWSNNRFYNDRLKIMTSRRANSYPVALMVHELKDADDHPEAKVNLREAEAVVAETRRLVESGEADRLTIGIISPYRAQADLIHKILLREFSDIPDALAGHRITASTADGFQGDERDIILYSFRYGPSSNPGVVTAIQNEEERLNVAFTRAKRLGICFISAPIERFPSGAIRDFLMHCRTIQNRVGDLSEQVDRPDQFDSEFERKVCRALRDRGLKVTTQEPCAGFRIDLVVEDGEGRILGVECDGEWKEDEFGRLRPEDYQRQDILERANWVIHRISGRRFYHNPEFEIDRAVDTLSRQPTAKDREIHIGPRLSEHQVDTGTGDMIPERPKAKAIPAHAASSQGHPPAPQPEQASGATEAEAHDPTLFDDLEDVAEERTEMRAHPEVLTSIDARLEFLGASPGAQLTAVKKLLRWGLEGTLEGSAIDDLNRTLDALNSKRDLTNSQVGYLSELWESARRQGFDPDEVVLPDVVG
jgi:very-short-patch-repair endonuclease